MCGRYHLTAPPERLGREFDLDIRENFPARYNIAPTQPVCVIRLGESGARQFALLRWGFVPSWAKKDDHHRPGSRPLINARADTVAQKPTFRAAFRRRRCLLPADGFYEWKGEAGAKQPYCIRRTDDDVFAFAGFWETARDGDGGEIDTVAILTTEAGPDLAALHNREPVVIDRANYDRWLGTQEEDALSLSPMLSPKHAGFWRMYPVSRHVNNARNEGERCVEAMTA